MTTVSWREAQTHITKGTDIAADAAAHAVAEYPQESVGIVVDGKYVPLKNVHVDPLNNFKVDGRALVKYKDRIQAVIHSHNTTYDNNKHTTHHTPFPGVDDQKAQLAWGVPFGIQFIADGEAAGLLFWGDSLPVAHYEGRPYIHAVYDCFSILRDYFREELGVFFPDCPRQDGWWNEGENLYMAHIREYGFEPVERTDPQPYDVAFFTVLSEVPNHAGLFLGGDNILHHLSTNTSRVDSASKWLNPQGPRFNSLWRYKDLPR